MELRLAYLNELEAETNRLRKLCGELCNKLAVLASHIADDRRGELMEIIGDLHRAAHGIPFTLKAEKKE
jgi:hypothetical protein